MAISSGAPQFSTQRMLSMPFQKIPMFSSQKIRKQVNWAALTCTWALLISPSTGVSARVGHWARAHS